MSPAGEKVLELLSKQTGIPAHSLKRSDRLLQDLGMDGEDADELFIEFSRQFGVDLATMDLTRHFSEEPHLGNIFRLPSTKRREFESKIPITVEDLVRAVESGRWPHDS